jgi:hypothetical protein
MALGGLLGVAWTLYRGRHRDGSSTIRRHRFGRASVAAALLVVVGGTVTRTYAAVVKVERCPVALPAGTIDRTQDVTAVSLAEEAATWVPTGIGMWDAYTFGEVCWIRPYRFYVGVHAKFPGLKYVTIGDVFLSRNGLAASQTPNRMQLAANTAHESRHRAQWAVATAVGGPLAFPIVYTVTDLFLPGARNPFERLAGLKQGNYNPYSSAEPVLRLPQIATLVGAAVVLEGLHHMTRSARRRRRESGSVARSAAPHAAGQATVSGEPVQRP